MAAFTSTGVWWSPAMTRLRAVVRDLLPPALLRMVAARALSWRGDYADWDDAARQAAGYACPDLHDRIEAATCEVLAGRAAYEQDGICFSEPSFRWPVLAAIQLACRHEGGWVLDFGGALGSSWLRHRSLLGDLRWAVVEQPGLVARGRRLFPAGSPGFFPSIDDAAAGFGRPGLVLLSAVLSWIADPEAVLRQVAQLDPELILIDRTGVCDRDRERITCQVCRPPLPPSSYPCRFFPRDRIPAMLAPRYRVLSSIVCDDRCDLPGLAFQGWLLRRSA
jgi:putative methyltransferase (TIGR04325 family)